MARVDGRRPPAPAGGQVLRTLDEALEHVHAICFKTGPPRRVGVELEWTVHHADDPGRPIDPATLRSALGDHTPRTLDPHSPQKALPGGDNLTLEPGGQVELSSPPHDSLAQLHSTTASDLSYLAEYELAPASVRWVSNQQCRWGSCTPEDGTIRISERVRGMPEWVLDYVVLHELVHLIVPTHGSYFWALVGRYPKAERARGYLEGVAAAVTPGPVPG